MNDALLDIVVLIHDKVEWADLCVKSVESFTKNPYRLILVDSASREQKTKDWFCAQEAKGHKVIRLAENKSFSNGVNMGVAAGSSKFICILNDDAICTEGWDGQLMQDASEKFTGLVGARSNYASGAQGNPTFVGEPPYLVFVCVCLRRDVWNTIGPMDEETFDGFSTEDIDYSWRVRKAGLKLKVSNAFVLHAGSRTLAATVGAYANANGDTTEARRKNDQKYNARLVDKWGKEWVGKNSNLYGKGLVVTYHSEEWTRAEFMKSLMGLRTDGRLPFELLTIHRAPIHIARQMACDHALNNGFEWIAQFDDDATFPPDTLARLYSHNKDVVTALAYQRKPPHWSCVFEVGEDGMLGAAMEGIENTGLRRVDVSGYHVSMVKTSVIRRLREGIKDADGKVIVPGITKYFGSFSDVVGEDFNFSLSCKKIGIQVHCDTSLIVGHIASSIPIDHDYKVRYQMGLKAAEAAGLSVR